MGVHQIKSVMLWVQQQAHVWTLLQLVLPALPQVCKNLLITCSLWLFGTPHGHSKNQRHALMVHALISLAHSQIYTCTRVACWFCLTSLLFVPLFPHHSRRPALLPPYFPFGQIPIHFQEPCTQ